jgi:hypothetical protein
MKKKGNEDGDVEFRFQIYKDVYCITVHSTVDIVKDQVN